MSSSKERKTSGTVILGGDTEHLHKSSSTTFQSTDAIGRDKASDDGATQADPAENGSAEVTQSTYEVEQILQKRRKDGVVQYYVKWAGYPEEDSTWEPLYNLTGCDNLIAKFNKKIKIVVDSGMKKENSKKRKKASPRKADSDDDDDIRYALPEKTFKNVMVSVDFDESVHQVRGELRPEISNEDSELAGELRKLIPLFAGFLGFLKPSELPEPVVVMKFFGNPSCTTTYPLRIVRRVLPEKLLDWYESRMDFLPKQM